MDNGCRLGFQGYEVVTWADVISGGDGINLVVRIPQGRYAQIEPGFLVFENKDRNYLIRGVTVSVPGVAYRTGPKGWMECVILPLWIREKRVLQKFSNELCRIFFVHNCSSHNWMDDLSAACPEINTEIRYFSKIPPTSYNLVIHL